MDILKVPARNDLPSYNFRIDLDGTVYELTFRYNGRMDRWFMDIADQRGVIIRAGIILLTEVDLFPFLKRDNYPQGDFFLFEDTGIIKNAGRLELGDNINLYYRTVS